MSNTKLPSCKNCQHYSFEQSGGITEPVDTEEYCAKDVFEEQSTAYKMAKDHEDSGINTFHEFMAAYCGHYSRFDEEADRKAKDETAYQANLESDKIYVDAKYLYD